MKRVKILFNHCCHQGYDTKTKKNSVKLRSGKKVFLCDWRVNVSLIFKTLSSFKPVTYWCCIMCPWPPFLHTMQAPKALSLLWCTTHPVLPWSDVIVPWYKMSAFLRFVPNQTLQFCLVTKQGTCKGSGMCLNWRHLLATCLVLMWTATRKKHESITGPDIVCSLRNPETNCFLH